MNSNQKEPGHTPDKMNLLPAFIKKTIQRVAINLNITPLSPTRIIPLPVQNTSGPSFSFVGNGLPVYGAADTMANIQDGYVSSEDVYSIVRRIARTAAMIPLKVYRVIDEKQLKVYQAATEQKNYSTQSLLKKQFLKFKALEEVAEDNSLQKLLDNPNPLYPRTEYNEGCYTFRMLSGNAYEHIPLLEFGVNAGKPTEMWIMPSQFTRIIANNQWPRSILKYVLQITTPIEIDPEEVIHTRYFNPQFTWGANELIGFSPLTAGSRVLTRQEAETDYSVNAFQNSGISGVVSNESLRSEEVEQAVLGKMKTDFYNEAAGVDNARKLLFMAGKINYTAVGLSPVDMNVLKSEIQTFKKLCNLFGVSDMLFNNDGIGNGIGGKTDIVFKDLYTNAALPEVYAKRDSYNSFLVPKFNTAKEKYFVDADITGITELQDDMKDMADVYSRLPIMNPHLIAQAFGWNTDTVADKWFIKSGYQTVDDAIAGAVQPLPVDTLNGD